MLHLPCSFCVLVCEFWCYACVGGAGGSVSLWRLCCVCYLGPILGTCLRREKGSGDQTAVRLCSGRAISFRERVIRFVVCVCVC
ncbi:hypothetical protein M758_9G126700 [Ceratodon purpureus]|nr:hypothetical protein M758_9G126700 [Ceratodon purpureus]